MSSAGRVQPTVFQKVASVGLQPWRAKEVAMRVRLPLEAQERHGKDEDQQVNRVHAREARDVEAALVQHGAVGVVVGKDEAGDQEEEADEGEGVIDQRPQKRGQRRREVEEHDIHGEQRAKAGQGRQRRLARGLPGSRRRRAGVGLAGEYGRVESGYG
jgi:hypothetical protein